MRKQKPTTVIFSAYNDYRDNHSNITRNLKLKDTLTSENINYKEVVGRYKGVFEMSLVVNVKDTNELQRIQELSDLYDQDCILHLDANRNATLLFNDSTKETSIGKFQACSEMIAKKLDSYTYCDLNKTYYIIK